MSPTLDPARDWVKTLSPIAAEFPLAGPLASAEPYGNGHINETYVLTCEAPGRARRYVLQKINHHVFKNVPALMENIQRVTSHLRRRSPRALALVAARTGPWCCQDAAGGWWRLYDFIEGARTVEQVTSETQAVAVARAFGEFQAQLADLPGGRLHETIPDFHHTRSRFEALRAAITADEKNRAASVRDEIGFAFAREADTDVLLQLLARGEVTERVTHNDTKINNVMLDDTTGRPAAIVDLDTVMPGLMLYDFGDMVRTAASSTAEDDPEPARMTLRLPLFRALARGYVEAAGAVLTQADLEHLAFAAKLMTFEVGLRFLTDHLRGDVYFRIKHPGHNLERCRTQFALVRSIEAQHDAMMRIVSEIRGRP